MHTQRESAQAANTDVIRFALDGEVIELGEVDPTRTVLQFLREDLRRTGTKEGCAEGDCGACTVVVGTLDQSGNELRLRAVNSCIQFLPTLDGMELFTVESLAMEGAEPHPVQHALVECHASQCGFCTPGFVMSLLALYKSNAHPTRVEIDDALAGNLCRCTGYRPIVDAAKKMYGLRSRSQAWLDQPHAKSEQPTRRIERLRSLKRRAGVKVKFGSRRFFAPLDVSELAGLLGQHPNATLLAGGTDVGLWVTKQHRELKTVIYTACVRELGRINVSSTHIEFGAAVSLTDAMAVIVRHFPGLDELFRRFGSPPIRNAGTLGGNIANGSPIGDSMPALIAADTVLVLRSSEGTRELALEKFYLGYRKKDLRAGECVQTIRIPLPGPGTILRSHKLSKRFDQDISAVCTAYRLELDGHRVRSFRMACGGLAPTVKRARHCEAAINGYQWDRQTVEGATAALARDFEPISDMRASAGYRLLGAQNLLRRFFLETRGELEQTLYSNGRQG